MRTLFINMFEFLIGVIALIACIAIIGVAVGLIGGFIPQDIVDRFNPPTQDPLVVGVTAIAALAYVFLFFGIIYVFLGIYRNTKRMADAAENPRAMRR
jgi:uncharacterized membrane protein